MKSCGDLCRADTHLVAVEEVHINVWDANDGRVRQTLIERHAPWPACTSIPSRRTSRWCRDHGPFCEPRVSGPARARGLDGLQRLGGKYPRTISTMPSGTSPEFRGALFRPGIVMKAAPSK